MFTGMEPAIKQLLTPDIMQQAAKLAQVDVGEIKLIRAFENFVYAFPFGNQQRILRITHNSHRSLPQVLAELDFIDHLANGGVSIACVLPNVEGKLASVINANDGSQFIVAIFMKANGVGAEGFDFTPEVLHSWGRVLGQMHHQTKSYKPDNWVVPRYQWYEDPLVKNGLTNPQLSEKAKLRLGALIERIKALPITKETFGLIHSDLHQGNFFVHYNLVTAFDFDDCCYQYFVHDIAIALYYALRRGYNGMNQKDFVGYFLKHLMKGYQLENSLSPQWIEELPLFLELRSFVLHEVLTQKLDRENATQQYLDLVGHMQKLTNGEEPLVSFDIDEVYKNA